MGNNEMPVFTQTKAEQKGRRASGQQDRPLCFIFRQEKRAKDNNCDYLHPSECIKKSQCNEGKTCAFLQSDNDYLQQDETRNTFLSLAKDVSPQNNAVSDAGGDPSVASGGRHSFAVSPSKNCKRQKGQSVTNVQKNEPKARGRDQNPTRVNMSPTEPEISFRKL